MPDFEQVQAEYTSLNIHSCDLFLQFWRSFNDSSTLVDSIQIATDVAFQDDFAQINPLSANPTKWSNTLKQFVGSLPTNCLSVFDHFVGLPLEWLSHETL